MSDIPSVSIRQLHKKFGETTVLENLDLNVAPGEKLSIIGPSGSGKSTLLRVLMTLEPPNSGEVDIFGETLWSMSSSKCILPADKTSLVEMRTQIGMVFQHFNLFPHKTALENVSLAPIHVKKMTRVKAEELAAEQLTLVGLGDKLDSYPAKLSGGQKQRVAIARALAMRPKIMLFDEVTSALDPELVGDVLNVLRDLAHDTDMTMLLVTHEMRFAREISDRVAFMDQGRVIELDSPDTIFSNPTQPRTREFLREELSQ